MSTGRFKITFPDDLPIHEIEKAVEVGFGGIGSAYRGPSDRTAFLHNLAMPLDLVSRQLAEFQKVGLILSWERLN